MTPLILTADEAVLAASDTLTEIRRPIEGLPANPVNVRHLGLGYLKCDAPPGSDTVSLRIQCPWGGEELLYACEVWGAGCRPDPFDGWRDGVEYQADEQWLVDEHDDLTLYDVTLPDGVDLCEYEGKGWQPAETMPVWAARFAYRGSVHVELADGVWQWVLAVERVNLNGAPVPPVECQ